MIYDEDGSQVRTATAPRGGHISTLRIAGWNEIAAALRHHGRDPNEPSHQS